MAVVLVAGRVLVATQMQRFADQLAPVAGVAPALPDLPTLVQADPPAFEERRDAPEPGCSPGCTLPIPTAR